MVGNMCDMLKASITSNELVPSKPRLTSKGKMQKILVSWTGDALSPGASSLRRGLLMLIWCHKLKDLESNFSLWWQLGLLRSPGSKPEAAGTLVGLSESIWQDDVRVKWWHSCINDFKCLWVDAVKAVRSPKKRRTDISYVAKMWIQMCFVDPQPKHLENHWFIPYYRTLKYIGCTLTMTVSSGLLFFTSSYLHRHIIAS